MEETVATPGALTQRQALQKYDAEKLHEIVQFVTRLISFSDNLSVFIYWYSFLY